ncbi:MAG: MFS transporter [Christensenellaceae bacterium]|nr:MFS transporter [Christensenellaceae bacterium]
MGSEGDLGESRAGLGWLRRKFGPSSKDYWTLSSIEFLFWFAAATGGYLTIFLQRQGFTPTQVGFINAINSAVTICATPFWGMMADKVRSIRRIFVYCMAAGALLWALVPISSAIKLGIGPLLLLHLLVPAGAFFRMPANSLLDAFVVQTSAARNVPYGSVRSWGSIAFAVMNISLSAILPLIGGVEITFYMYGMAFIPLLFILWNMKNADQAISGGRKSVPFKEMRFSRLFKNYYFITYLTFAIIWQMPVNTSMTFLPYLVDSVGGDTAQFGLVTGYKALLEVPMLLLMRRFRKRFPLPLAIVCSGIFYIIESSLYVNAHSLIDIMLIQSLHGLGGGLMIGSAANYIFSLAPEGLNSTAHTVHGAVNSVAAIIGQLIGGMLIERLGIKPFYSLTAYMILGAVLYFCLTLFVGRKILKKPIAPLE